MLVLLVSMIWETLGGKKKLELYSQQSKLLVRKFSICKSAIDKGAKNLKIDLFVISSIQFV